MKIKPLSIAILSASALALSQLAVAQDSEVVEEEVTVTGIRQSLEAAADLKRNSFRISDAIVAEDIGKLPDNNIAEALQRITGVSIDTDFGVGESVSIRGLKENRIELNGRSTLGDDRDGVSLDDFPSSFLKTVEVIKSPTADMIEGALGGTVRMETVRPLELKELTAAGSFDFEHADKTGNAAPIFNASIGNNWDAGNAGTFGAIGMVSYQDREIRQDEFFNRVRLYDEDAGGAGAQGTGNTASGRFAVREQNTVEQFVENRERTAVNLSLQWAPASEAGNIYIDLTQSDRSGSQAGSSILDVGGSRVYNANTTQDANGQVNNYTLEGAFVIPKTFSEFRETDTTSHALGGEWNFTDQIKISGELSIASSESSEPDSEFNLRPVNRTNWNIWADQYEAGVSDYDDDRGAFDLRHTIDATFTQSGDNIPSVIYSDPEALTNPENLAVRAFFHNDVRTKNDETALRFDFEYADAFGLDFLSSLKAGVRSTKNDYKFNRSTYRASDIYKNAFTGLGTDDEAPSTIWIDEFEELFPGTFETVSHPNSFDQAGLSGQNDLLTYRIYRGDLLADANATFLRIQQILDGTNLETTGSLSDNLEVDEGAFRDITEETNAIYLSGDLDFGPVTAVVGGRYIETDIESTVFVDGALVTGSHDYSDFLPSLNVTYTFAEDTLLRFAAAKVMRRANYEDLSPAFLIDNSLKTAEQGAIELDPFRATQFDVSLEHYFGSGNLVSAAIFYKDVDSFFGTSNTCVANSVALNQEVTEWVNVCQLDAVGVDNPELVFSSEADFPGAADPDAAGFQFVEGLRDAGLTGIATNQVTNGEDGKVKGFEVGYQQNFDFLPGAWAGLGVNANYTYTDSENPNGNTLLDISEDTVNAQVYWENDSFQVRLAYNYRSRFLDTEEETRVANVGALGLNSSTNDETSDSFDPTAGNNYRESRGQFDLSASYDFNDHITGVFSANNLTGEPVVLSSELGSNWKYTEADRRFTFGVRAKF